MNNIKPHLLSIAAILFVVILIFHSVLLPPKPLLAQDAPLVSQVLARQKAASGDNLYWNTAGYLGTGGGNIYRKTKFYIDFAHLKRFVPLTLINTFNFPLAVFIVGIAFYLFCLSLDLKPISALTGAVSIMLAGHFTSCIYSGHTGKFFMLAYLSLALWLLTAGIKKRSILALLWAGVCGGLGVSAQLDVGFIIVIFFAAWLLFLVLQTKNQKNWFKLTAGLIIACLAGLLYSASTIYSLAGLAKSETGAGVAAKAVRTEAEKWNWATQWSLPKIETLTFVMPGFFGFGLPNSPYWGNVGRDARWETRRVGFPRFSMSTQNMGIVVVALALLALITASARDDYSKKSIYFWGAALIIALLCAYGRYFDFGGAAASGFGPYRLFYYLPKMDSMRNPLKFLYPFMIALSVLAAFGMDYLLSSKVDKKK